MSETITYKCPNCDAGLIWDADNGRFKCEYCISSFSREELDNTEGAKKAENAMENGEADASSFADSEEIDSDIESKSEEYCAHMVEYNCPSCGAEILCDENTAAHICCYCHNPVVLTGRLVGDLAPSKIIPFKYSKDEAKSRFLEFVKKKKFVPKDFKDPEHIDKITGIYYPFFLTDADTDSQINARGTKVRSWFAGNYKYTETSHFDIMRRGDIHFEDIATSAFSLADKEMLEGILPYPSEALIDFDMSYLSGFMAKKRNLEKSDLESEVAGKINSYSEQLLRGTIGPYTTLSVKKRRASILRNHWDYSLMPIWLLTYKNKKGKTFTYAMNGYTGKIYGQLPISGKKVTLGSLLTGLGAFLLILLIGGISLL